MMKKKLIIGLLAGILLGAGFTASAAFTTVPLTKNGVLEMLGFKQDSFCIGCTATSGPYKLEVSGTVGASSFTATSTTATSTFTNTAISSTTISAILGSGSLSLGPTVGPKTRPQDTYASTTYYVSDTLSCTVGPCFSSIQEAFDHAPVRAHNNFTIRVVGTYNHPTEDIIVWPMWIDRIDPTLSLTERVGARLIGDNTTPGNVVIGSLFTTGIYGDTLSIQGLTCSHSNPYDNEHSCFGLYNSHEVSLSNITFTGPNGGTGVMCYGSNCQSEGNIDIGNGVMKNYARAKHSGMFKQDPSYSNSIRGYATDTIYANDGGEMMVYNTGQATATALNKTVSSSNGLLLDIATHRLWGVDAVEPGTSDRFGYRPDYLTNFSTENTFLDYGTTANRHLRLGTTNNGFLTSFINLVDDNGLAPAVIKMGTSNGSADATTSLILSNVGFLGLGTTTPYARLSVAGANSSVTGYAVAVTDVASTSLFTISNSGVASSSAIVVSKTVTGPQGILNIISTGQVGIGVTNPIANIGSSYLTVEGGDVVMGNEANTSQQLNFRRNAATTFQIGTTNNQFSLNVGTFSSTNNISAQNGPRLGIGTTTPNAILAVAGNTALAADLFDVATSTTNSTSSVFRISRTGNVGIGTTSPYSMLSVAGQVVAQNFVATSTTQSSSFQNVGVTGLTATGIANLNGFTNSGNGTTTSLSLTGTTACSGALQTDAIGTIICGAASGAASTTLLTDNNTFSGNNRFGNDTDNILVYSAGMSQLGTSHVQSPYAILTDFIRFGFDGPADPGTDGGYVQFSGNSGGTGNTNGGSVIFDVGAPQGTGATGTYKFGGANGFYTNLRFSSTTVDRHQTFQDKDGTIALLSDITGGGFSTTSADYWDTTKARWGTTSSDFHLSSTTSLPNLATIGSTTGTTTVPGGVKLGNQVAVQRSTGNLQIGASGLINSYGLETSGVNVYMHTAAGGAKLYIPDSGSGISVASGASPVSGLNVGSNASIGSNYTSIAAPTNGLIVTGRTGIGTSSPWAMLSVNSTLASPTSPIVAFSTSSAGLGTTTPFILGADGVTTLQNLLMTGSSTLKNATATAIYANVASSSDLGATNATLGTAFIRALTVDSCTGCGGGSLSGGTAGMLSSWVNATTLTATGTPTFASLFATSSTATSTFAGSVVVGTTTGNSDEVFDIWGNTNQNPFGIHNDIGTEILSVLNNGLMWITGKLSIGTTTSQHKLNVYGRIDQTSNISCALPWTSNTAMTADSLGSATVPAYLCGAQLLYDMNTTGSIQPTSDTDMASGTPAMNVLRSGGPTWNFSYMKTPGFIGSATSTNGDGIAMSGWFRTPNVSTASTTFTYSFGFSSTTAVSTTSPHQYTFTPASSVKQAGCMAIASSTANWQLVAVNDSGTFTQTDTGFATSTSAFMASLILNGTGCSVTFNNATSPHATISSGVPTKWMRAVVGVGSTGAGGLGTQGYLGVGNLRIWTMY